ncbi:MAG: hypothetical protein AB8F65_01865 [Woeseiaceae bacterium]
MTAEMTNLEEIRGLLFGREQEKLAALDRRISEPDVRAVDVSAVLPEAIRQSHADGAALVRRLRPPVDECVKAGLRDSPESYADALYPVMGPAIRRSISETLKAYTQQINQTMEQGLSLKYLRWRFQASRAGVPFAQYVLQKTLEYRVEQGYLISRDNGLLIAHVHHEEAQVGDNDAVSAMFTAIQDFVKDSFSPDSPGRLEVADMGEFALWGVHGPKALLVCVIRGVPPRSLRAELSRLLERIHGEFEPDLTNFNGDTSALSGIELRLAECLGFQARSNEAKQPTLFKRPLLWLLLLGLLAAGWFAYKAWDQNRHHHAVVDAFSNVPGIYLDRVDYESGTHVLYGLRDPLAPTEDALIAASALPVQNWQSLLRPYQSLDPEIIQQRVLSKLSLPASVSANWVDGALVLVGEAPTTWHANVTLLRQTGSMGVEVDTSGVVISDAAPMKIPPPPTDQALFDAELNRFAETTWFFDDGLKLADRTGFSTYTEKLAGLVERARQLSLPIRIEVEGWADGVGSESENTILSASRASFIVRELGLVVSSADVTFETLPPRWAQGAFGSEFRKVIIRLSVVTE